MLAPMDTAHDTQPPGGPPPPGSRPPLGGITRASDDVVISGLCGGLGRHFGIDPLVFRIAFVVMALAGGMGLVLYLVGWALVPDDTGETFGARWLPGSDRGHKLIAAGLAGGGLLLLFDEVFDGHGNDVPLGLVLVGLGAAVLWSRREGRTPAPPPGGWTINPPGSGPVAPPPPPAGPPGAPTWPPGPPTGGGSYAEEGTGEARSDEPADPTVADPMTPDPSAPDPSAWSETAPPPAGSSAWSETAPGTRPLLPLAAPPARLARVPEPRAPREPRSPRPPRPPKPRSVLVSVTLSLLAVLAGVVVLAGADLVTGLALALFLVSGALVVGAWRGRARGLIPMAVLLASALFVASLLDVPFEGGAGQRVYAPRSVAEVQSPYRLVAGELLLDLRNLGLTGQTVPVVASMATGNIVVTVPARAAVEVHGEVGAGDMVVFGRDWAGVGIDERVTQPGEEGAGRLVLDLHVGLGQLEVRRAAP